MEHSINDGKHNLLPRYKTNNKNEVDNETGKLSDDTILKHVALITNLVWKRYDNDGNGVIDAYEEILKRIEKESSNAT